MSDEVMRTTNPDMNNARRMSDDFPHLGDPECDALAAELEAMDWPELVSYSIQPWQTGRAIIAEVYVHAGRLSKVGVTLPRSAHANELAGILRKIVVSGVNGLRGSE